MKPLTPHPSPLTSHHAALVVFAKAPVPGQVKTRLCPPLTPDEAATLHGSFVLDTLERTKAAAAQFKLPIDRYLACAPSSTVGAADVGVHPVHGAPSGRNENLVINRRVKLVLRVPVAHLEDARTLTGKTINPGAGELKIGDLKEKQLTPFAYLYSHFVCMGTADEAEFMDAVRKELDAAGVKCGLIPGRKRKMSSPGGDLWGYSLMLHDVELLQSLQIQETGLGMGRNQGCGIFIPHKSIKEVEIN